jgi:hypothetical protein
MDRPLKHPNDIELAAFSKRTATPTAIVAIDRHLSACEDCRKKLEEIAGTEAFYAGVRAAIGDAAADHLSYEQVRDAAKGRPAPDAARHLEACSACRMEVADLSGFIATLDSKPERKPHAAPVAPPRMVWRWAIAAAVLVGLLPLAWWASHRGQVIDYAVAIHDGGALVGLDTGGKLHTPYQIPPKYGAALQDALRTRRLTVPEAFQRASREVLLGSRQPSSDLALTVLHPTGEAVLTGRPRFEWEAPRPADTYRVSVYDRNFRLVAESPDLRATQWTPAEDLTAGQTYTWVVTARMGGRQIRAPLPPAPEARFTVLAQPEAERLQQARQRYPDAHLMLAALFAQAGAFEAARQELEALARANPGSPLVREIESSLPAVAAQEPAPSSTKPAQ